MSSAATFLPLLLDGAAVTVTITVFSSLVAILVAFIMAFARISPIWFVRIIAIIYVEFFRGTSLLVQLFWLFFVLPHFGIVLEPMLVGILGIGLNFGAYGAEVVRAAILAVPREQQEAARSLALSQRQTMWLVTLPQSLPPMIPLWGNLFIELMKATAVVSLITIADLTFTAYQLNTSTLRTFELFSYVLVIYLMIALVITAGMRWLERRLSHGLGRGGIR